MRKNLKNELIKKEITVKNIFRSGFVVEKSGVTGTVLFKDFDVDVMLFLNLVDIYS